MTSILRCTCSSACRADSTCDRLPRFQAHLDAAHDTQHPRIHMSTEACASHLGTMVIAMATWAREQDLTNADLTILAIEPPPRESYPRQLPRRSWAKTSGLVFSTIHLGEQQTPAAEMPPDAPGAPRQNSAALPPGAGGRDAYVGQGPPVPPNVPLWPT